MNDRNPAAVTEVSVRAGRRRSLPIPKNVHTNLSGSIIRNRRADYPKVCSTSKNEGSLLRHRAIGVRSVGNRSQVPFAGGIASRHQRWACAGAYRAHLTGRTDARRGSMTFAPVSAPAFDGRRCSGPFLPYDRAMPSIHRLTLGAEAPGARHGSAHGSARRCAADPRGCSRRADDMPSSARDRQPV